ncbi:MAG: hypothetical protein KatS3mg015_1537 [Fimbriimonadales bacterium]|nr:MAG: hypothetical protein KatS3mg015_1537 [Fimbriimonadales bacterium]
MKVRKTGFTITEVLVAMVIIVLVASLLYPVFLKLRSRSLELVCISNLRQIHGAAMLYRADYGGDGVYGTPEEMGLPYWMDQLEEAGYLPRNSGVFKCTAPASALEPSYPAVYMGFWLTPGWREYCLAYRENSILLADVNHNSPTNPLRSPYVVHHCVALYLSGQIRILHKTGRPMELTWWNEP